MGNFEAFIENENDISAWIKWIHPGVPDEEGEERNQAKDRLVMFNHCVKCLILSGCYFVTNRMPGHLPPDMLHPHCDCTCIYVNANSVRTQIKSKCTSDKLIFTFTKKGKAPIYENIGYTLENPEALISEYERQAKEKYGKGEYVISKLFDYGVIINIEIILRGNGKTRYIKSGWQVFPSGRIYCVTPFAGWSRKNESL